MRKILTYFKAHIFSFLLIVVLLFSQAQAELALPGYMSDIISYGIINNGISSPVPKALSQESYNKISLFLSKSEKAQVQKIYNLIQTNQASKQEIIDFPLLESEDLYILADKNLITNQITNQFQLAQTIIGALDSGVFSISDLSTLPEGTDFYMALELMSENDKTQLLNTIKSELDNLGDQMIQGVALNFVKSEYKKIGLDIEKLQSDYILEVGIKMLAITLISVAAAFLVGFFSSKTAAKIAQKIRLDLYSKIQAFNAAEYSSFSTASLITRTTNDVQLFQQFIVMFLRIVIYAPIIGFGAILKVLQSNSEITWIIGATVLIIIVFMLASFALIVPRFTIIQKLIDKLNLVMRESLSGIMVIRAFNTQNYQADKFDEINKDVVKNQLFVGNAFAIVRPLLEMFLNMVILLIIWTSAQQINLGVMKIGDMTAFIQYAMQIIMSFIMISMMAVMIPRAQVAIKRIFEVLDKDIEIKDAQNPIKLDTTLGAEIFFDNVSFRYPNAEADVISNLTFTAKVGTTTAFIGSTGSGKSTLVNLIPRFYDVSGGAIKINGIDIRDISLENLREKIAVVPQNANLFSGSIASNLQMGKEDASHKEMEKAIELAQASDFVLNRSEKLAAQISQAGTNVSGGQKQRLSIARALIKEAKILIFDDSFSALDFKTDANIRRQLDHYIKEKSATVLIVGQRISSIMDSDQIIVLDQGLACGAGTHSELMQTCPVYQEIANSQLTEEEIENVKK